MVAMQFFLWLFGAGLVALVSSALVAVLAAIGTGYVLYRAKYHCIADKSKEIGVALALIVVVVGGTLIIDNYHEVKPEEFFMVIISLSFFPVVGWDYRKQFKSVSFALFFAIWSLIHGALFIVVMKSYGWSGELAAIPVELFVFYLGVTLIFRLPLPSDSNDDEQEKPKITE